MKSAIAILVSMFFANIAEACRCSNLMSTDEMVSHYQNIARVVPFELKIINFIENTKENIAAEGKVKTLEIYKGSADSVLAFKSNVMGSNCGRTLEVGREYILLWNTDIALSACSNNWVELNYYNWPKFKGNRPPLVNYLTSAEIIEKIKGKHGL
jgi:hypothetical protein